ncbi:hypothetical protein [Streptomyces sp. MAI_2237]
MAHLRAFVWGPAEFVGSPPGWLVGEGILAGFLGAGSIVGTAVFGAWTGRPYMADGAAGLVCAVALTLYLFLVRAGRALVGVACLLGVCLALQAPQAADGLVLAARGQVQAVVVTSVDDGQAVDGATGRYLCSVVDGEGIPLKVRIWRGCRRTTRPGDALAVVYDPEGRVPPRGAQAGSGAAGSLDDLVPWGAAFVASCVVAVVRSYRLSSAAGSPARPGLGGDVHR